MKTLKGIALHDTKGKTLKVGVMKISRHPLYGKQIKLTKKYLVHDERGEIKQDDKVTIKETFPRSKRKHFEVVYIEEPLRK